jgi:hypothetical protein
VSSSLKNIKLWIAGKIPYEFDPQDHPHKKEIYAAMKEIEDNTNIWFCQRGNEVDFVKITNDKGRVSYTNGIGIEKRPVILNIVSGFVSLHELGHVLGLIHEQTRSDRDEKIIVKWESIRADDTWDKKEIKQKNHQFELIFDSINLTEYDPVSIMHYPAPATGWQGQPSDKEVWTMRWKEDETKKLGAGPNNGWEYLSGKDVDGLLKLYSHSSVKGWDEALELDAASGSNPALAVFNNKLYMAWKGRDDNWIWWSSSDDGIDWSEPKRNDQVSTNATPALAVFNNKLYMAWKGDNNTWIWWSSLGIQDGNEIWSDQQRNEQVGISAEAVTPALATFNDTLYMAWKGRDDDWIWWSSLRIDQDGREIWSDQKKNESVSTATSPALAVFSDKLYMMWYGINNDGIFWSSFDGSSWSVQNRYDKPGTRKKLALAVYQNKLYVAWQGSGDNWIWYADFNGTDNPWSGQARLKNFVSDGFPALTEFKARGQESRLFMMWKASNKKIYTSYFTL